MRGIQINTSGYSQISSSRFCVATTFYGISFNITGFGLNMYLTQLVYALIELPTKIGVYYILDMIGRRISMASMMLMSGTCLGINILIPYGKDDCGTSEVECGVDLSAWACFQTCLSRGRSSPSSEKRSLPHHLQFSSSTVPSSFRQ